jgi:hypothetical protein
MVPQHVRLSLARLLVVALAAVGVGAALPTPAQARSITWRYLTLPGGGDSFYNYDFHSRSLRSNNVDWPVNLLFWNNATVPKVKSVVAADFPYIGGVKSAYVAGSWDDDRGRKTYPATCSGGTTYPNTVYHFRVYAPSNTDRMYNVNYGYFVIGTSHIDYREGCTSGDRWFGSSESAEAYIAGRFAARGRSVVQDVRWLNNYESYAREGSGLWYNGGYASVISIS